MMEAQRAPDPAWLAAAAPLEAAAGAAPSGVERAAALLRLGDLHLAWDRPADAVKAYEGAAVEVGTVDHPPPKVWSAADRILPCLAIPVAPPGAATVPELVARARLGAAFGYLGQGQVGAARYFLAELGASPSPTLAGWVLVARGGAIAGQPRPGDPTLSEVVSALEALPDDPTLTPRIRLLRVLARASASTWETWPALMADAQALAGTPAFAATAWSLIAEQASRVAPALARHAEELTRGGNDHDAAVAATALGRLELAAGRPRAAASALRRALQHFGARAGVLDTDAARVGLVNFARGTRDLLVDALLAGADLPAAAWAAEDVRALALELDIPGEAAHAFVPWRLVYLVRDEVCLVFAVGEGPGSVLVHAAPVGRVELAERVSSLHLALGVEGRRISRVDDPGSPPPGVGAARALAELYDLLVAPLLPHIADAPSLVVEPDGPLWAVPFAALGPEGAPPLGARFPLVYGPSAGVVDRLRARPPSEHTGVLVVGNPTMPLVGNGRPPQLPGADAEAEDVAGLFGGVALRGAHATLPRVLREMAQARVIHLGTHGIADPADPTRGFLVFAASDESDGLLTPLGIAAGPPPEHAPFMAAQAAPGVPSGGEWLDADLVVLSACQSAGGQAGADGVIGVARAFLLAGARTVVASQWNVDDDATRALMRHFYEAWIGGMDAAGALRQASERVRRISPDPRLWAPFIVLGSGGIAPGAHPRPRGDMAAAA